MKDLLKLLGLVSDLPPHLGDELGVSVEREAPSMMNTKYTQDLSLTFLHS